MTESADLTIQTISGRAVDGHLPSTITDVQCLVALCQLAHQLRDSSGSTSRSFFNRRNASRTGVLLSLNWSAMSCLEVGKVYQVCC